jgi:SAM-dependent methyltransferase
LSLDRFHDSYSDEVERAIAFAGRDHDFFVGAKIDELLSVIRTHVGDPRELSFVDVGCGIGVAAPFLRGHVASFEGVDVSSALVERARSLHPWARFTVSGDRLPFDNGSFDVAFAFCVLHHVEREEQERLVAEMARVVRSGGAVVVAEHNPLNPLTRVVVYRCAFDEDVDLLTSGRVATLLATVGLRVVERRYILVFPSRRPAFRRIERAAQRIPLGAQHLVAAVR